MAIVITSDGHLDYDGDLSEIDSIIHDSNESLTKKDYDDIKQTALRSLINPRKALEEFNKRH